MVKKFFDKINSSIKAILAILLSLSVITLIGVTLIQTHNCTAQTKVINALYEERGVHERELELYKASVRREVEAELAKTALLDEKKFQMQDNAVTVKLSANADKNTKALTFNPNDVTVPSNMTLDQCKYFVAKLCPNWVGQEQLLLEVDKELNLIFLFSVARMETWAGTACVGEYNSFNIREDDAIGSYVDYNNYGESIQHFKRLILNEYVSPEGLWHEGSSSIMDIGKHYATEIWAPAITELGYEIIEDIQAECP